MKKRVLALILAAATVVSLSGCTTLFKKDYLSVTKYQADIKNSSSRDIGQISDYAELKNAIISMVNNHQTEGRLRFTDYDGTILGDISQALWEVKAESALASFAVDYMSYDLSRIVTYYEAVVYITYKHTQSEISDIHYITGRSELADIIQTLLEEMDSYVALRITSSTITGEEITAAVSKAYEQNPASCVVPPIVTVTIHPESGLQRIIEIELEYGWKLTELQKMKSALNEKVQKIVENAANIKPAALALDLYEKLAQNCAYDPTGSMRSSRTELNSGLGATAYGALVEGYADSKGFAAAYSALCRAVGIDCQVVEGTQSGETHYWDIIKLGDFYYHIDASAYYAAGIAHSFMQSDEQMRENYEWDAEKYPVCSDQKTYSDIIKRIF